MSPLDRHATRERKSVFLRLTAVAAMVCTTFLISATSAWAAFYGYYHGWGYLEEASSSYSTSWCCNYFGKDYSGFSTTVTWINNVNYGWSGTVTNSNAVTSTSRSSGSTPSEKAYCRSNTSGFFGACEVL